jgi:hypothetical protein
MLAEYDDLADPGLRVDSDVGGSCRNDHEELSDADVRVDPNARRGFGHGRVREVDRQHAHRELVRLALRLHRAIGPVTDAASERDLDHGGREQQDGQDDAKRHQSPRTPPDRSSDEDASSDRDERDGQRDVPVDGHDVERVQEPQDAENCEEQSEQ